MKLPEHVIRAAFVKFCKEGVRPEMYTLKQTASDEYVSHFTEDAWQIYKRAWYDYAHSLLTQRVGRRTR